MITRTTRINNLNEKPSLILWGRVRFKSYVFVLKFCISKGASYIVNDIGRFAREVITNLNESPRSSPLRYE